MTKENIIAAIAAARAEYKRENTELLRRFTPASRKSDKEARRLAFAEAHAQLCQRLMSRAFAAIEKEADK